MFSNFFFSKILRLRDKLEKSVERGRPQMAIQCTRIACWISKSTKTHYEFVILAAFPLQQRLHEHASVAHYAYLTLLVFIYKNVSCISINSISLAMYKVVQI